MNRHCEICGEGLQWGERGWGYLNGQRCGLSEEDAMEVANGKASVEG